MAFGFVVTDKADQLERSRDLKYCALDVHIQIDCRKRHMHDVGRATVSHVEQQADGVSQFLQSDGHKSLVVQATFDDVGVWVQVDNRAGRASGQPAH